MFVIYELNNVATNPYAEWQKQGRPKTPTPQNFKQIREKEVNFKRSTTLGLYFMIRSFVFQWIYIQSTVAV